MKNSCLYKCTVMHHRLEPKQNRFEYNLFMFSLDLDELDDVVKNNPFISRNTFNLFSFREKDHLQFHDTSRSTVKDHVLHYIRTNGGPGDSIKRIQLITNLCTLGYQFNPVSFYFAFDENDHPRCAVVEVTNTYREMKLYYLGAEHFSDNNFSLRKTKHFYVSPFIAMDADFDFSLDIPGNKMNIRINDYQDGKRIFLSSLTGSRKRLTFWNVLGYAIRFPFITIQIITLIHWQALRLWLKKISHYPKASAIELQQNVLRPHKSITE